MHRPFSVGAIIPARNEEATIADVVLAVRERSDEIIVVDSCSTDGTREVATEAGARVVVACRPGKDEAIYTGIEAARSDLLVFMDGDLSSPDRRLIDDPVELFQSNPALALAKGFYRRRRTDEPYGGRLTEICARPLLTLLQPSLAGFLDPLAGEFAAWRKVLLDVRLWPGYAVDLGILVQLASSGQVAEYQVYAEKNRHRSLQDLGSAAVDVAYALLGSSGVPLSSTFTYHSRYNIASTPVTKSFRVVPAFSAGRPVSRALSECAPHQRVPDALARLPETVPDQHRSAVEAVLAVLYAREDVLACFLGGSRVKGDADEHSDLDLYLLVDSPDEKAATASIRSDLQRAPTVDLVLLQGFFPWLGQTLTVLLQRELSFAIDVGIRSMHVLHDFTSYSDAQVIWNRGIPLPKLASRTESSVLPFDETVIIHAMKIRKHLSRGHLWQCSAVLSRVRELVVHRLRLHELGGQEYCGSPSRRVENALSADDLCRLESTFPEFTTGSLAEKAVQLLDWYIELQPAEYLESSTVTRLREIRTFILGFNQCMSVPNS
jgi:glucosyl-3-phosphoglycerate synthase